MRAVVGKSYVSLNFSVFFKQQMFSFFGSQQKQLQQEQTWMNGTVSIFAAALDVVWTQPYASSKNKSSGRNLD